MFETRLFRLKNRYYHPNFPCFSIFEIYFSLQTFIQPIIDINNHEPTFDFTEYTYKLPTPFPTGVEITQLGLEIIVTDLDVTNIGMNFEIDSPDLDVVHNGTTGKRHKAILVPNRPLEFTSTQTFLLTATVSIIFVLYTNVLLFSIIAMI